MDIRKKRTWCEDCTAPLIPQSEVPIIRAFIDALPAWRCAGGMTPVLTEGFDRAELAAIIAHANLPGAPAESFRALLDMESEYREIRAAMQPAKGQSAANHAASFGASYG